MLTKTLIVIALAFVALGAFRWAVAKPRPRWMAPALVGVATAALLWRFGVAGIALGALAAALAWFAPRGERAPRDLSFAEAAALLGVSPDASRDDIRAAHRRLIAAAHPDAGGATQRAAQLNAARDLLLKRAKR